MREMTYFCKQRMLLNSSFMSSRYRKKTGDSRLWRREIEDITLSAITTRKTVVI